jgi:hypothetical protein
VRAAFLLDEDHAGRARLRRERHEGEIGRVYPQGRRDIQQDLIASALKILAAVALGLPLVVFLLQDQLIFHPQRLPQPQREALAKRFAGLESVFIEGADGTRLHAWHVKPAPGAPLVIYFGGNAEEVSWMLDEVVRRAPGVGWLLVDYRGYGASEGSPSEKALVSDALRWYDSISTKTKNIYVFGRSLGSGVAVQLAAERAVAGVILVAAFDSLAAVAKRYYWYLPVDLMLKHRFDSIALAPRLQQPLLCLISERDEIIPPVHAERLFDAWGGAKRKIILQEAGHNSSDAHPMFWQSITTFLSKPGS